MSTTAHEQRFEDVHGISDAVSVMTTSLSKKSDGAQTREEEVVNISGEVENRLEQEQIDEGVILEDEFKLHVNPSLIIIICTNILMQISFFVVVSSSSAYAAHLGGSATFSGLVIGIPAAVSGASLLPFMKYDKGQYAFPLHFACASLALGSLLYGLAYKTKFLYLILLGRMVQGLGYTYFMHCKRYCSDSRIVGVRRRTLLAGWLVVGQGLGLSAGPFIGGLLSKIGFSNDVFNGYSAPGWVMFVVFLIHWAIVTLYFKDPPREETARQDFELSPRPSSSRIGNALRQLNKRQWGVIATMCWFALANFFMLGAWEANIPVFTSSHPSMPSAGLTSRSPFNATSFLYELSPRDLHRFSSLPFHWSPFAAGNFLALGGITIFPFLLLNMLFSRRTQDRHILALGSGLGFSGLLIALALFASQPAHGTLTYGSFFICWFLVALGFNLATTCTLSLLSKQLPPSWNGLTSLAIQYCNNLGRVCGAVWGGSGVKVGMINYVGLEIAIVGIGAVMFTTLWKELKTKTG
ncbi:MFS general substrate transporter [Schizopora paradoxa]|uniref:MFS general substrate transporter n=1 Tax=Schizopora paradoxa TaxID=27342 RepID=A0A0H2RD06_9AGAM|nr:MFS general substrate transporter [Schizopora paradoxa]